MKKAQVSIEFVILISFMFLVFLVYTSAIQSRAIDFAKNADRVLIEQLGQKTLTELDAASFVENGFRYTFSLPETLLGKNYNMLLCAYYLDYTNERDNVRNNAAACGGQVIDIAELVLQYSDSVSQLPLKISRNIVAQPDSLKLGEMNCLRKENNVVYVNHPSFLC